jgi:hypothetical protein
VSVWDFVQVFYNGRRIHPMLFERRDEVRIADVILLVSQQAEFSLAMATVRVHSRQIES